MASSLFGNNQQPNNQMLNNNNIEQMKQMANMIDKSGNPMQMLQKMMGNNPQLKSIMELLNGGMSAKEVFMQQAKQMGFDPQQIINMLK